MKPKEKQELILSSDKELCDHCLGRQFAKLGHGLENYERAYILRNIENVKKSDFTEENVPSSIKEGGSCEFCQGIFDELQDLLKRLEKGVERYEFDTFLIGVRPSKKMVSKEEELWEEFGTEYTETIKTELSRLLGKKMEASTEKTVDFNRPDINPVLDLTEGKKTVELQVNSLLIYGQYNKYSRNLPQTVWHCRNCRGSGCEECDWSGKNYETSVQEIIQKPFIESTNAIEAAFHGGGREDVDARCLGQREFVLELKEPLNRNIDISSLERKVNESQDKVEIFNLREAEKSEIETIKQSRTDKTYRAIVRTEKEIEEGDLPDSSSLETILSQRTPQRVSQRRADKLRQREIKRVTLERKGANKIDLRVRAEAGTYIKEFISGDNGRTEPSLAGELGKSAECEKLDILWVEKASQQYRI